MRLHRRRFLLAAAGALAAPALPRLAQAQAYPTRPIRLLVGFPPGAGADITARLLGHHLSERLGQQVVVDNRPGAGGSIAVAATVNAAPDGYTLLMLVSSNVVNATLYPKVEFDFLRDIAPIASFSDTPYLMLLNPQVPAKTVPEFVAYAKANPGKINYSSGGTGSSSHVFGELFAMLAGVDLVHVPYRTNSMPDLLSGQVQMSIAPIPQAMQFVRSGKLNVLGVSTAKRLPGLPDIPAIGESVAGYEAIGWFGLGAPRNIPPAIVAQLNAAVNAALADDNKLKASLADTGVQPMPMTPEAFGAFMAREKEKWAKVITARGIKAE